MPTHVPNPVEYGAFGETPAGVFSQSPLWARGPNPLIGNAFIMQGIAAGNTYPRTGVPVSDVYAVDPFQFINVSPYAIPGSSMFSLDRSNWENAFDNQGSDSRALLALQSSPITFPGPYGGPVTYGGPWYRFQSSKVTVKDGKNFVKSPSGALIPKITYAYYKYQPRRYTTVLRSVYGQINQHSVFGDSYEFQQLLNNPVDFEIGIADYQTDKRFPIFNYKSGIICRNPSAVQLVNYGQGHYNYLGTGLNYNSSTGHFVSVSGCDYSLSFDSRQVMGATRYWYPYIIHPLALWPNYVDEYYNGESPFCLWGGFST